MADFLLLGQQKQGSYALSETKSKMFYQSLMSLLDNIAETINTQAVPELFELNGWERDELPYLAHGKAEPINLEALGNFLGRLTDMGMVLDDRLENHLRGIADHALERHETAAFSAQSKAGQLSRKPRQPKRPELASMDGRGKRQCRRWLALMVNGWWWRCGNGTPCKACQEREGQFFPLSVPFQQIHDNCVCYPELSEVEDPEYSEMVPEEEIPGLQRISFETNEPAPEVPQIGDEDLKFIMPQSPDAGLGEMRQIPTFQKDVNPMKYFSSFDELWAHCQPSLDSGSELYVEKAGQRREFSTRRELSILDRWAGGATIVTGGAERAVLFKAEMQPLRVSERKGGLCRCLS